MYERILFADALRGVGALTVLLAHVYACFIFPVHNIAQNAAHYIFLFDGQWAVNVFFVVSGFSLSTNFINCSDTTKRTILLQNLAYRRYFRLAMPILLTTLCIYFLINCGLMFNHSAYEVTQNEWIRKFYGFDAVTIKDVFIFSMYKAFVHGTSGPELSFSLNPVLWTISLELAGSALIFLVLFVFNKSRMRFIAYLSMMIVFYYANSYMAFFIGGVIVAELYPLLIKTSSSLICDIICVLAIGLLFYYNSLSLGNKSIYISLFVLAFSCSSIGNCFSRHKSALFLGKISYCLYLVHLPIICSLLAFLLTKPLILHSKLFSLLAGLLACLVSVAIATILSKIETVVLGWQKQLFSVSKL